MNKAKNYKVSIFGDHYSLWGDESEECITQAATLLDSLMKEIAEKYNMADTKKVAVLAALRVASSLLQVEATLERSQHKKQHLIDLIDRELIAASISN